MSIPFNGGAAFNGGVGWVLGQGELQGGTDTLQRLDAGAAAAFAYALRGASSTVERLDAGAAIVFAPSQTWPTSVSSTHTVRAPAQGAESGRTFTLHPADRDVFAVDFWPLCLRPDADAAVRLLAAEAVGGGLDVSTNPAVGAAMSSNTVLIALDNPARAGTHVVRVQVLTAAGRERSCLFRVAVPSA
jgi:hypothetical protein